MPGTLNKVLLIGYLGQDPEIHHYEHLKLARFNLATADVYVNREGKKVEQTEWHRIVVSQKELANFCEQYLFKGNQVYVEGRLQYRFWMDNKGMQRQSVQIVANQLSLLNKSETAVEGSTRLLDNQGAFGQGTNNHSPI